MAALAASIAWVQMSWSQFQMSFGAKFQYLEPCSGANLFPQLLPETWRYPKNKYVGKKVVVVRWFLSIFKQIPSLFFAILSKMQFFLNRSQEIMVTNKISVIHGSLFRITFMFPANDQINYALSPFHSLIGIQFGR